MSLGPPRYDVDFSLDMGLVGIGAGVDDDVKK